MNILFLIGNGFDLNVGLRTRYKDVLECYFQEQNNDPRIKQFKEYIGEGSEEWADFEKQLGACTEKYKEDEIEDFCICVKNFKNFLMKYLKNEEDKINYDMHKNEIIGICSDIFLNFYKYLNPDFQDFFQHMSSVQKSVTYNFITFNYTSVLIRCLSRMRKYYDYNINIEEILHIHGNISKSPLIGVDNAEQIKNKEFANNDKISKLIIKPIINQRLKNSHDKIAFKLIQKSDVICLFGLSIGETDITWWQCIGKRLQQSDTRLVIFSIVENLDPTQADEEIENKENVINKFYLRADIDDKIKTQLDPKIDIVLNTNLFKMNLLNNDEHSESETK